MRMSCPSAAAASNQRLIPHPTHRVADRRDVPELPQRGQSGRLGILAALDPVLHAERQVAADFVVEVAIVRPHGAIPRPPAPGS